MRREIRISGQGGQGVITLGLIFGRASSLYDNKNVIMTEAYGPEQTGGFAQTDLIISDEEIEYPMVNSPDILVVLSKEGWEMNGKKIKKDGKIIYEDFMVNPSASSNEKYGIPALNKANEMGKKVVMNVIMMGALQEITNLVSKEALEKALLERVPKGTEELNLQALKAGYELARGKGGN
jgi:2-oxoglutarate ferredoxin oxidoreductase subunit gamma